MSHTDGLEPQQYGRHYWEEDVPLADVRKNTLRRFVYIGCGLFIILCLVGACIKFPEQVELPFILKSGKYEDIYRFPYPVYVIEKYKAPGTVVNAGDALIKITSPEIVKLINDYLEAQQQVNNYRQQKNISVEKQQEIINSRVRVNQIKISEARNELNMLDHTWKSNDERLKLESENADKNYTNNKELYNGKYISKAEFKDFEEKKVRADNARNTARLNYEKEKAGLEALINQYSVDIASLQQETGKLSSDTRYDSLALKAQLETAKNRISNTFGNFDIMDGNLVLKANAGGTVTYIFDGDKEVQGSAVLMKINNGNSDLYSLAFCPPTMIGKIARNQAAYLKVATFPSYEWGSVAGHIDNLSLNYDEKGNFNVRIALDDYRKLDHMLQQGMTGNVTIVLQEKTFFQYFFRKTREIYHRVAMEN